MRIAHLCLSCFYIDGMGYQENDLVREHVRAGHEVMVIASTETMDPQTGLKYVEPASYDGRDGAPVTRLPYRKWLPHKVMRKLRMHPGVYEQLAAFRPETILFHGTCGWELRNVARYVRDHSDVLLYVDSHEDIYNSARDPISREILHKRFYGPVLRGALPRIKRILNFSTESMDFVERTYRVPRDKLEWFPIGGYPLGDEEYEKRRRETRVRFGLGDDQIAIVQSGKQQKRKRLIEALDAFAQVNDPRLQLFIAGTLQNDIREASEQRIAADPRVRFLGWQSPDSLTDLLCMADVYLQPGTTSATMQHSLSCRCAVILDDIPSHVPFQQDNGWFIAARNQDELVAALGEISGADLATMQKNSQRFAQEKLDYTVLAKRILS